MRITLLSILLLICLVFIILVVVRKAFTLLKKIIFVCLAFCIFIVGSSIINLNTLSKDVEEKISYVTEVCGTTYIKTSGSKVLVKIGEDWVDVEEIKIIGNFAKDSKIEFDGEVITIESPGIKNTLRTLEKLDLLK